MNQHTPGPWHWHDAFGRKDGKGEARGVGIGPTGDEPPMGQVTRFSFCVSDEQKFVVARCSNALVTMSSDISEANARLIAAAPTMFNYLTLLASRGDDEARAIVSQITGS